MRAAFVSWISRWLPRGGHRLRVLRLGPIDRRLRGIYDSYRGPVRTRLHGFPATINGGNPYPFLLVSFPDFNRALVELARITSAALGRPLVVIDVGASLGNTVLLLQAEAAPAIAAIHCVEADEEFLPLLRENTAQFPSVVLHQAMLARAAGPISSLVHQHRGTATAAGSTKVEATTVDALLLNVAPRFDLLKIDIDGSDGEALAGAGALLRRDQPAVIFEWHPALIRGAGNDPFAAFAALSAAGYRRFLWFRNTGPFSHFSTADDPEIAVWEEYLREMQPHSDPHFDIIALPPRLESLAASIASLGRLPAPRLSSS